MVIHYCCDPRQQLKYQHTPRRRIKSNWLHMDSLLLAESWSHIINCDWTGLPMLAITCKDTVLLFKHCDKHRPVLDRNVSLHPVNQPNCTCKGRFCAIKTSLQGFKQISELQTPYSVKLNEMTISDKQEKLYSKNFTIREATYHFHVCDDIIRIKWYFIVSRCEQKPKNIITHTSLCLTQNLHLRYAVHQHPSIFHCISEPMLSHRHLFQSAFHQLKPRDFVHIQSCAA
jgi:hypothetical protein